MEQNRLEQQEVNNSILQKYQIFDSFTASLLFLTVLHWDKEPLLFPFLAFSHAQGSSWLEEVLRISSVSVPGPAEGFVLPQLSQWNPQVHVSSSPDRKQGCSGVVSHVLHWRGWAPPVLLSL